MTNSTKNCFNSKWKSMHERFIIIMQMLAFNRCLMRRSIRWAHIVRPTCLCTLLINLIFASFVVHCEANIRQDAHKTAQYLYEWGRAIDAMWTVTNSSCTPTNSDINWSIRILQSEFCRNSRGRVLKWDDPNIFERSVFYARVLIFSHRKNTQI